MELLFAHHILNRASQTHEFSYRRQHIARIYIFRRSENDTFYLQDPPRTDARC